MRTGWWPNPSNSLRSSFQAEANAGGGRSGTPGFDEVIRDLDVLDAVVGEVVRHSPAMYSFHPNERYRVSTLGSHHR